MKRSQLLEELAQRIDRIKRPHPVRVAIDGVDAAGKTTLADDIVPPLQARERSVIRASIDGFHTPARLRYQRGSISPVGYYQDSFNYHALIESLLVPLGPDGSLQYRPAVFDYRTDSAVHGPLRVAEVNAVLLFDGVFLLRSELREYWEFSIFIDANFEVTLARAQQRDYTFLGNVAEVTKRYEQRYIPGQKLYLEECRPKERAAITIDNNDPANPLLYEGQD